MKRQQPSTGSQTDPDAVVEEYLAHISALTESNDSLKDDVDGLNYKVCTAAHRLKYHYDDYIIFAPATFCA